MIKWVAKMNSRRGKRNKKRVRVVVVATIAILFCITTGYAAFSTSLVLNVKGNIKMLMQRGN